MSSPLRSKKSEMELIEKQGDTLKFVSRFSTIHIFGFRPLSLLSSIQQIEVSPKNILIKTSRGDDRYLWEDILDACAVKDSQIIGRVRVSSYELVLRAKNKKVFQFNNNQFGGGRILVDEVLPKYLKIKARTFKEPNWFYIVSIAAILGFLVAFVRTYHWTYAIGSFISVFLYYYLREKIKINQVLS